jgi:hypothetical protein
MSIPSKEAVIQQLEEYYETKLSPIQGKRILYEGTLSNKLRIVVCTPQTKIHAQGQGWVDISKTQVEEFKNFDISILAIRMEGNMMYYMHFDTLRPYFTDESLLTNKTAGEFWRLYLWPDKIQIVRNKEMLSIEPNNLNNL